MRRRVLSSVVAVLASLATIGSTATVQAAPEPDGSEQHERERRSHARIVDYWTQERMAQARPRDLETRRHGHKHDQAGQRGRGDAKAVRLAEWRASGAPVARTAGKVFFMFDGEPFSCSATAVRSPHRDLDLILTAGHCVWGTSDSPEHVDVDGAEFADFFLFVPGFEGGWLPGVINPPREYDVWTAQTFYTTPGWQEDGNLGDDTAIVAMTNPDTTFERKLGNRLPTVAFPSWRGALLGDTVSAFGYPSQLGGNTLAYCEGAMTGDAPEPGSVGVPCGLTGGASGGPWYSDPRGKGAIVSLNSYLADGDDRVFGPVFDRGELPLVAALANGQCDPGEACASL
jgi:hypothetical protein